MFFKRTLLLFSSFVARVVSQDVGFVLDGTIQGASTTDLSFNTGGFISTNGWKFIVPKNLQVGFPAAWVAWKDFVASYTAGLFDNFEVSVAGNVVPGIGAVAGQVYISQLFLHASQGFISQVNNDGTIKIANGPTIRINDPNAVYSVGYTGCPFMTADDENSSISSWGGFPMCVPRNSTDPLCPASNRPGNRQGVFIAPDPLVMAPFVPGDFVEYAGYVNKAGEVVCYELTAVNVQINTGADFGFLRMEDALIGVFSADPSAESADSRFIGYTSETAASPVTVSAIELDPCTGEETLRGVASGSVKAGDVRNKFELRSPARSTDRYTREYLVQTNTASRLTNNKITAGRYVQPVTDWIQPELAVLGAAPVAFEFAAFNHLTQGLGADEQGNVWGPLDPFPQTGVKVFDTLSCPKIIPPSSPSSAPAPPISGTPATPIPSSPSSTSSSIPSTTPTAIPRDTVTLISATWISSGGGTFAVTCTSSNTNNTLVGMVPDYKLLKDGTTTFNLPMTGSGSQPGTWTYSAKVKQPTTVWCRSKLKGSATGPVR